MRKIVYSSAAVIPCLIAGLMVGSPLAHAQSGDNDLLRRAQMQLRQSEQERNSLRGEVARLQTQLEMQMAELEKTRQQATHAQGSQSSVSAELTARASKLNQVNQSLKAAQDDIEKLRADNARQAQAVQNVQEMLKQAQKGVVVREEMVELLRTRNQELYKVGTELIAMYRNKDLNSLAKREPVLQLQQVKLQNLMQEFEDRLRTSRVYKDTLPPSVEKAMQESLRKNASTESSPPTG